MQLIKSENYNENYLSKVVNIESFEKHPDPEVTRLKVAHVDGFKVIVGINEIPGKFIYFPTSSCINPQLLSFANLYRDYNKNNDGDPNNTGLFEDNGRVKAVKLRGLVSEGFLLPLTTFVNFIVDSTNIDFTSDDCEIGTEFDAVEHNGKSFWISKKFVVVKEKNTNKINTQKRYIKSQKGLKRFNKVIDTQFRFHYETARLERVPEAIKPNDLISITSKWDGTSAIFAYVLCKQPLNWKQKIAKWLTGEEFNKYDYIYASRRVIKNKNINENVGNGFYGSNEVYEEAFKVVKPYLIKGMTIYAELVGYNPSGSHIQKRGDVMDYGCVPPVFTENNEGKLVSVEPYTYGKHFKIAIYRITLTNVDGVVYEFSAHEVQQWCKKNELTPVIEYYYGVAKDLYPELDANSDTWSTDFLEKLSNDKKFYMEMNSPECKNKVPHEGIVIRNENTQSHAVKVKCFAHFNLEQKAQDDGEEDMEDNA